MRSKMIYKLWSFIPSFIKNYIKYICFLLLYKKHIDLKTINNLTLDYILSKKLTISRNVDLGSNNYFWWIISIWDFTYINWPWSNIRWDYLSNITIWKFCSISFGVTILAWWDHNYLNLTTFPFFKPELIKNTVIWNDVWIWVNSIILPWINIWNWAIIWAWSIVTKDIPSYSIAVWNPAKVIKYRFDEETIKNLEYSKWWDWPIEDIKNNYNLEFIKNER